MHYRILDQFGAVLPRNVPVNEHFARQIADAAGMNWRPSDPGAALVRPQNWFDQIRARRRGMSPLRSRRGRGRGHARFPLARALAGWEHDDQPWEASASP